MQHEIPSSISAINKTLVSSSIAPIAKLPCVLPLNLCGNAVLCFVCSFPFPQVALQFPTKFWQSKMKGSMVFGQIPVSPEQRGLFNVFYDLTTVTQVIALPLFLVVYF